MYVVDHVYISDDVAEEAFVCDLQKCKGACCVEGELGAPLETVELIILDEIYEAVAPFLTEEGKAAIKQQGKYVEAEEGEYVTPTLNGAECAYAFYDEQGTLKCGIEAAYRAGKTDFQKPISCHLYPIRVTALAQEEALNYHRWDICSPACQLGESLKVPVYRFLKEPLIRRYGAEWYTKLEAQISQQRKSDNE